MSLPDVSGEVVYGDVLAAVGAVGLLAQVNALHVVVEKLLGLELLLAVRALVVSDLFVEILDVVIQILVLFVADVTRRGLGEMNLSDVILQCVLCNKFLLAQGTLSDLREVGYEYLLGTVWILNLPYCDNAP